MPEPHYTVAAAARASGLHRRTIIAWIERGYLVLGDRDLASPGPRQPTRFSFETILQIAIAAALSRRGVPPREALVAALAFSSSGGLDALGGQLRRRPGRPFEGPGVRTIGRFRPPAELEIFAVSPDDSSIRTAWYSLFDGTRSEILLDLGQIYQDVMRRLGLEEPEGMEGMKEARDEVA